MVNPVINPWFAQVIQEVLEKRRRRPELVASETTTARVSGEPGQADRKTEGLLGEDLNDIIEQAKQLAKILRGTWGDSLEPSVVPPRVWLAEKAEQLLRGRPGDPLWKRILGGLGGVGLAALSSLLGLSRSFGTRSQGDWVTMGPTEWAAYLDEMRRQQEAEKLKTAYSIASELYKQTTREREEAKREIAKLPPETYKLVKDTYKSAVPALLQNFFSGEEGMKRAEAIVASDRRYVDLPQPVVISTESILGRILVVNAGRDAVKRALSESMSSFGKELEGSYGGENVRYEISEDGMTFYRVPLSVRPLMEEKEQTIEERQRQTGETVNVGPEDTEEAAIERIISNVYGGRGRDITQRGTRIVHVILEPVSNKVVAQVVSARGRKEAEVETFQRRTRIQDERRDEKERDKAAAAALGVYGIKPPPMPSSLTDSFKSRMGKFPNVPLRTVAAVGAHIGDQFPEWQDILSPLTPRLDALLESPSAFRDAVLSMLRESDTFRNRLREAASPMITLTVQGLAAAVRAFPESSVPSTGSFASDRFFNDALAELKNVAKKNPNAPIVRDALLGLLGFFMLDMWHQQRERQRRR